MNKLKLPKNVIFCGGNTGVEKPSANKVKFHEQEQPFNFEVAYFQVLNESTIDKIYIFVAGTPYPCFYPAHLLRPVPP